MYALTCEVESSSLQLIAEIIRGVFSEEGGAVTAVKNRSRFEGSELNGSISLLLGSR